MLINNKCFKYQKCSLSYFQTDKQNNLFYELVKNSALKVTKNRKHRRAAAKPAACAPNAVNTREQGKEGV